MPVITRRYTPPTCTLEITAQTSALSRWTQKPALKSLDFLLSFNEVRDRNQQPIEVQGNQQQLESLSEAVSTYIQQFLGQPLLQPVSAESIASTASLPETPDVLSLPVPVHLRPHQALSHELVLGALATEQSGPFLALKPSQLFDLASALDEYAAEVATLPTQVPTPVRPGVPVWAKAAGLILLIGGTSVALTQFLGSGLGDPSSLTVSQEQGPPESDTAQSPPRPSPIPTLPPDVTLPTQTPSLPEVQLPNRDAAEAPNPLSGDTQRPGRSQTRNARPQTSQPPLANLPPLPKQPDPIDLNPKNIPEPEPLDAPTVIAGRPPQKPGQSNLESGRADRLSGSTDLDTSSAETAAPSRSQSPEKRQSIGLSAAEPQLAESAPSAPISPATSPRRKTAFDTTPQVAEVRQYLGQRWQVPPDLQRTKQTLQYTLILNPNGSIQTIKPRGQAATQYLKQTPIPAVNQPFISPAKQAPAVRVVFNPDGTVQTFPEAKP